MHKLVLYFLVFILIEPVIAGVVINEFLPDPIGTDNAPMPDGEWVELYNSGTDAIDLEGFVLYDSYDTNELYITDTNIDGNLVLQPNEYSVIYRNGDGDFSLNNNGDEIRLYDGYPLSTSNLIDEVIYSDSKTGDSWSLINDNWQQTTPTPGTENSHTAQNETGIVDYVIDGDTFNLTNREWVRLIGIDTPEAGEYYYEEAKDRLKELVEGKSVLLEIDVEDKDMYNRLLRYIYIDDVFVNLILVEEGYAKTYPYEPNIKYEDEFAEAEERAQNSRLGIWSLSQDYTTLKINEIMYNPYDSIQCPDANCEWIELYNNGTVPVELSGWTIDDYNFEDVIILPNEYIIIARELIDLNGGNSFEAHWGNNDSIWDSNDGNYKAVDGYFSLINSGGDTIILKDNNGEIIDSLTYDNSWGANGNGYTLEKINPNRTNSQENWGVSLIKNGTPGYQNSIYGAGDIDYSVISINEFLPNPHGYDNAPMPQGEWIELYNSGNHAINLKWSYFNDLYGHSVYITDTTTVDTTTISANGFLVVYTNGFSGLLNNNGTEELELYSKDNVLIDIVSYGGSDEGSSWAKVAGYWQRTMPTPNQENIDYTGVKNSKFDIEKIYDLGSDNIAKFGQTIRAKVNIYKGDETKSVVRLWVADEDEKISKESKVTISTKYTNISLAVPIQLYPNCKEKYDDGDYTVFVGWASESSAEDSFPLEVEDITNSMCEKVKVEISSTTSRKKFLYELVSKPNEIEIDKSFETAIKLTNNDDEDYGIDIWSYVYRGSKSYSGDREENKQSFILHESESKTIKLKNKIQKASPGDYKLKVKIRKDNQKTTKDITETVEIIKKEIDETKEQDFCVNEENNNKKTRPFIPNQYPLVIYESNSYKTKRLVPFFIIGLLGFFSIILIWRR